MSSELHTHPRSRKVRFQDSQSSLTGIPSQREATVAERHAPEPEQRTPVRDPDLGVRLAIIGMAVGIVVYLAIFLMLALHVWT